MESAPVVNNLLKIHNIPKRKKLEACLDDIQNIKNEKYVPKNEGRDRAEMI